MKVQLLGLCNEPVSVAGLEGRIQAGEGQVLVAHLVSLEGEEKPGDVARRLESMLGEKRGRK